MLPTLVLTGIGSMITSAVACLLTIESVPATFGGRMETWLVSWPTVFLLVYPVGRPRIRLALCPQPTARPLQSGTES